MGGIEPCTYRLREVDVKAEHFERHAQTVEHERDQWEQKYEVSLLNLLVSWVIHHDYPQEMSEKYKASKKELDDLVKDMEGL